jgi:FG-GAP-like repeat
MRRTLTVLTVALLLPCLALPWIPLPNRVEARLAEDKIAIPDFEMKEIDKSLGVGYAVLLLDINGDGKADIVVVDQTRVVWYENPTWKRHVIIEGQTRPDNVCIAAADIDGDGQIDFVLGADWKPFNTKAGGTLQWLKRGKTLDEPWKVYPIGEEPTVHRIRFADLDGTGKPVLVVGPLMGRNSTKEKNWMDGSPVRMLAYRIPKDPTRDRWESEVIDESLHVVHNFAPVPSSSGKGMDVLTASYDGVHLLSHAGDNWKRRQLGTGNQDKPESNRGASEIKQGKLKSGRKFIATIEPWHGNQVVVYTQPADPSALWERHVIDEQLKWGHAVWCADLDGDGDDELIIGVRDNLSGNPGEKCGVRIYKATDGKGAKWQRKLLDEGGVAVEDLAAADLDGDGKIDIVAVGRATHNVRIYRNLGKK